MKRLIFAGLAILTASCGVENESSQMTATDDLASKVIGRYAIRANVATIQNLPFIGKKPAVASAYSLIEIRSKGTGLVVIERNCHMEIASDNGLVNQIIPDALPQSMADLESLFRVWQDGTVIRFAKDPAVQIVGAKLDKLEDALPTSPTDPRVLDQDGDGHPGVTVKVTGKLASGEIYLVQRVRINWNGTVDAKGQLSALLQDAGEQSVLDASSPVLKSKPEITPDPDASKSNVSFKPLAADAKLTCAQLIQDIPNLWPQKN